MTEEMDNEKEICDECGRLAVVKFKCDVPKFAEDSIRLFGGNVLHFCSKSCRDQWFDVERRKAETRKD